MILILGLTVSLLALAYRFATVLDHSIEDVFLMEDQDSTAG